MTPVFTSPALMLKPAERFGQGSEWVLTVFKYLGSDLQRRDSVYLESLKRMMSSAYRKTFHFGIKAQVACDESRQPREEEGAAFPLWISTPAGSPRWAGMATRRHRPGRVEGFWGGALGLQWTALEGVVVLFYFLRWLVQLWAWHPQTHSFRFSLG